MRFLCLEHLMGPGESVDENFEIMNLELIKAVNPQSESFRLSPPDGGIDIYCRSKAPDYNLAFQCKAYPTFKSNLVQAVTKSARAAASSAKSYPWDKYILVIPFVPTSVQRAKLEGALRECGSRYQVVDSDELETMLFKHTSIARRFFPNLTVITPSEHGRIVLGYPDDPTMLQVYLRVHTWKETILVSVSPNAKTGSLLQLLIGQLTLPVKGSVSCVGITGYEVKWELILGTRRKHVLDLEKTLPEQGVKTGATIFLRYSFSVGTTALFASGFSFPYAYLESLFSHKRHELRKEISKSDDQLCYWLDDHLRVSESILPKHAEQRGG